VVIFRNHLALGPLSVMVVALGASLYLVALGGNRRNWLVVGAGVIIGLAAMTWYHLVVRPPTPEIKFGTLALGYIMGGAICMLLPALRRTA
jgi:hypothetical protein